jgi:hypothetical protein
MMVKKDKEESYGGEKQKQCNLDCREEEKDNQKEETGRRAENNFKKKLQREKK